MEKGGKNHFEKPKQLFLFESIDRVSMSVLRYFDRLTATNVQQDLDHGNSGLHLAVGGTDKRRHNFCAHEWEL